MPDVKIAVDRFATPTSTGNQDWTTADLGGRTPKAAMHVFFKAASDATPRDHIIAGVGFTDGTSSGFAGISSEHGVTTTNTDGKQTSSNAIDVLGDTGSSSNNIQAAFSSWLTNGIRQNFTAADAAALCQTVFFAGDDLQAKAGTVTLGTQDTEINVNTVGFQADFIFFAMVGVSIEDTRSDTDGCMSFGVFDGTTQRGLAFKSRSAVSTSEVAAELFTSRVGSYDPATVSATPLFTVEAGNLDSEGFSLWARGNNSSGAKVYYLALNFGGLGAWVGSLNSPTATGDWAITSPGFLPQFVGMCLSNLQAEDSYINTSDAGALGISLVTPDAEFCGSFAERDNVTTTDNQCLSGDVAVHLTNDAGSQTHLASRASFDSLGWTYNFTATDGTARKWFGWAVEAPAAANENVLLGENPVSAIYHGSDPITAAYHGSTQIWP